MLPLNNKMQVDCVHLLRWIKSSLHRAHSPPSLPLPAHGRSKTSSAASPLSEFSFFFAEFMLLECEAFACTQHIPAGGGFWLDLFSITAGSVLAFDQSLGRRRQRGRPCPDTADGLGSRGDAEHRGSGTEQITVSGGRNTEPLPRTLTSCYSPRGTIPLWKTVCARVCVRGETRVRRFWPVPETCFKLVPCEFFITVS